MGLTGEHSGRGLRKSATAQLGPVARRLLRVLLDIEEKMRVGELDQRLEIANEGIPWNLASVSAAVDALPASTSRALGLLEDRRLVCCWGRGEGRNRRISHVKLSAQAVEVAQAERRHPGISEAQHRRRAVAMYVKQEADATDFKTYQEVR